MVEIEKLYGDLWPRYDAELYEESVQLFEKRFRANGFDLGWFKGKRCVDVGCGGGRYSIAMARLGAAVVHGCDISETGLVYARGMAEGLPQIYFGQGDVLNLPYADDLFDFVCCSGVVHHTKDPERAMSELVRVLKPGGKLYLMVYGSPGIRWRLIVELRASAETAGYDYMDHLMRHVDLPANKQRTFLDDLFVPVLGFFDWDAVESLLTANGLVDIERWEKGKLDHESSLEVQREEIEQLKLVFEVGEMPDAVGCVNRALTALDKAEMRYSRGDIGPIERDRRVFGEGNIRLLATRGAPSVE